MESSAMVGRKKPSKTPLKKQLQVPTLRSSFARSRAVFKAHRKSILTVTGIYGALYFIFVRVLTNIDINDLAETINLVFGNGDENLYTQFILAGSLFGESANLDQVSGFYFTSLIIINSLAFMWVMRRIWDKKKVVVTDAYYQGMYPLVPVLILMGVMIVQALPFAVGSFILNTTINNGLAVGFAERLVSLAIFVTGLIVSGYFLSGSVLAMYTATIPGTTPRQALTRSKHILKGRRFLVLRQMIVFLLLTALVSVALLLLVILVLQPAAIVTTALIIVVLLPWMHLYFYGLYRDLTDE